MSKWKGKKDKADDGQVPEKAEPVATTEESGDTHTEPAVSTPEKEKQEDTQAAPAGDIVVVQKDDGKPVQALKDAHFRSVTCESLTVKMGAGRVVINCQDQCAGIWVEAAPKGDAHPRSLIAIYDDKSQGPVIGFYKDIGEADLAMTCAIALDVNGDPQLQVVQGGRVGQINLVDILNLIKPNWRS